jgi:hypothetical protein
MAALETDMNIQIPRAFVCENSCQLMYALNLRKIKLLLWPAILLEMEMSPCHVYFLASLAEPSNFVYPLNRNSILDPLLRITEC